MFPKVEQKSKVEKIRKKILKKKNREQIVEIQYPNNRSSRKKNREETTK